MTKEELIAQLTTWKTQYASALDALKVSYTSSFDALKARHAQDLDASKEAYVSDLGTLASNVDESVAVLRVDVEHSIDDLKADQEGQIAETKSQYVAELDAMKAEFQIQFNACEKQYADALTATRAQFQTSLDSILAAAAVVPPPVVVVPPPVAVVPPAKIGLLVPAYFYPASTGLIYWNQLIAAASKLPVAAIANPNSGPGTSANSDYVSVINRSKAAGVRVLGYVSTRFGARPAADIQADVQRWKTFYGVTDIFFDEMTTDAANVTKYKGFFDYVRTLSPGAFITGNPGTSCDQGYVTTAKADLVLMSENTTLASIPAWAVAAEDRYFAGAVYSVTAANMPTVVSQFRPKGFGYAFVTNDVLSNPWDTLPPYFAQLVDLLVAA